MSVEVLELGEICDFTYGDSLREDRRQPGNVPVYGSNGVVGWHDEAITHGPTIIVGRKGSIGEVNFSVSPCFPIDTTYYVEKTKKPCDLRWLYYALIALDLTKLNKSAAVPGLNRDDAYAKRVPFPLILEQPRIAALLDRTDRLRRTRRYAAQLSDTFLQAVFARMFGDPRTNPMGWDSEPIEELCAKVIDYRGRTPPYSDNGIRHITASCIKDSRIDWTQCKYVSEETYSEYMTRGFPERGDVLFTTEAPLGETAVVDTDEQFSLAQRIVLS